ncbi:hypothetical protein FGU65_01225 [Methanoculleus sp. FWC-SCC1]|uniref:Uncharacterized protein n=1 Tax=Methanoculleus frigidifontis TaxID=2584085 RepID=A0ABT8M6G8_9EURY|nr:hypothetical protein [Methanoculleus sp. FWC-SCC1]MDN7023534.1 hypothetical protein [Methanoculleus sp. FWC-SCC1]
MKRVYGAIFMAAVLTLALASAGCAELPPEETPFWSGGGSSGDGGQEGPSASPTPTYVTPATPYPTERAIAEVAQPTYRTPPESERLNNEYLEIYNKTARYDYTKEAFVYNLTAPPLLVAFTVDPDTITRTKTVTSQYGSQKTQTVKFTNIDSNVWFEITIRDQGTGAVVAQDGFARLYSSETQKEMVVRTAGVYLVEITGNKVHVDLLMRAKSL